MISNERVMRAMDQFGKSVRLFRAPKIGTSDPKDYIKKVMRLCETPHPSVPRVIAEVRDPASPSGLSVAFEPYEEDLHSWITRRSSSLPAAFVTPSELLWIYRQIVGALSVWAAPGIVHGRICPSNVLIARNGQGQSVFKIGDLALNDETHLAPEQLAGWSGDAQSDKFAVGLILYEIATLQVFRQADYTQARAAMRAALEAKDSAVRVRYASVATALDVVLLLVEEDHSRRPMIKNVQIALTAIDIRGLLVVCDVHSFCMQFSKAQLRLLMSLSSLQAPVMLLSKQLAKETLNRNTNSAFCFASADILLKAVLTATKQLSKNI